MMNFIKNVDVKEAAVIFGAAAVAGGAIFGAKKGFGKLKEHLPKKDKKVVEEQKPEEVEVVEEK